MRVWNAMDLSVTTSSVTFSLGVEGRAKRGSQRQCFVDASSCRLHKRASDDNATGQVRNGLCLCGSRDAKPYADRQIGRALQSRDGGSELTRDRLLHSRHSKAADEIHESASVARYLFHSLQRSSRRNEPDERELALTKPRLAFLVGAHRKIGYQNSIDSRACCAVETAFTCGEDRIEVAEQHHRNVQTCLRD